MAFARRPALMLMLASLASCSVDYLDDKTGLDASGSGGVSASGGVGSSGGSGGSGGGAGATDGSAGAAGTGDVVTLAGGEDQPRALAVSQGYVYFTTLGGSVKRVAKAGGGAQTLFSGVGPFRQIALDGSYVYWVDGPAGAVKRVEQAASGGTPEEVAVTAAEAVIAVDLEHLFYAVPGGVYRTPREGGAVTPLSTQVGAPKALALNPSEVFFTETSTPGSLRRVSQDPTSLTPCPSGDSQPCCMADNQLSASDVVVDGNEVYWSTADGHVKHVKNDRGCNDTPAVLTTQTSAIDAIATTPNASWLYWVSAAAGRVGRSARALDGGPADAVVAEGETEPRDVAVDDDTVYWTTETAIRSRLFATIP